MIHDGDYNRNGYMDYILSLMAYIKKILCEPIIDTAYERTLCSQILEPWYWYYNVNGGTTRWKFGWIIKVYGW